VADAEPINQAVLSIGYHPGAEMMPGGSGSMAGGAMPSMPHHAAGGPIYYAQNMYNPAAGPPAGYPPIPPGYYGQDNGMFPTPMPQQGDMAPPMWGYQPHFFPPHYGGMSEGQIQRSNTAGGQPPLGTVSPYYMPPNFSNPPGGPAAMPLPHPQQSYPYIPSPDPDNPT
jgi:hypothetical protein